MLDDMIDLSDGFSTTYVVSSPVDKFDKSVENLVDKLFELCADEAHIGLAAPQIGINKRVFVVVHEDLIDAFVNPEVTILVPYTFSHWEQCLSLPELTALVDRVYKLKIKYKDRKGNNKSRVLEGFKAAIIQHELDHLNGVMIHNRGTQVKKG
jgi:peptide deformylase